MTDFSFSDLGKVHWGSTLRLAAARGFATGVVIGVVALFQGNAMGLLIPFFLAVVGLPLALFYHGVGMLFGMFIPLLGTFIMLAGSLLVCIGDPIVYFVNRQWPALLNIADLGFFNFRPLIMITYPD
jgi:hypothetical protein